MPSIEEVVIISMYVAERDVSALGRVQKVKGLARGMRGSRARYRRNGRGGDVVVLWANTTRVWLRSRRLSLTCTGTV